MSLQEWIGAQRCVPGRTEAVVPWPGPKSVDYARLNIRRGLHYSRTDWPIAVKQQIVWCCHCYCGAHCFFPLIGIISQSSFISVKQLRLAANRKPRDTWALAAQLMRRSQENWLLSSRHRGPSGEAVNPLQRIVTSLDALISGQTRPLSMLHALTIILSLMRMLSFSLRLSTSMTHSIASSD